MGREGSLAHSLIDASYMARSAWPSWCSRKASSDLLGRAEGQGLLRHRADRHVDAARDAARAAVAGILPAVQVRGQGIDGADCRIADGGADLLPADEQAGARAGGQRGGGVVPRAALGRAAFRLPPVEAAIEHGGIVEADGAQHPPDARRPLQVLPRVEHDPAGVADPLGRQAGGEILGRRHGEVEGTRRVRQRALQVEERRTRDMRGLVIGAAALDAIRAAGAGLVAQVGGAVEDAPCRIAQVIREPGRFHDGLGVRVASGHGGLQRDLGAA